MYSLVTVHGSWWQYVQVWLQYMTVGGSMYSLDCLICVIPMSVFPVCRYDDTIIPACDVYSIVYTGCPRRKGPNFGRVFLRSNYADITQNTYIQSSMVTEILAREKCGHLLCLFTVERP